MGTLSVFMNHSSVPMPDTAEGRLFSQKGIPHFSPLCIERCSSRPLHEEVRDLFDSTDQLQGTEALCNPLNNYSTAH